MSFLQYLAKGLANCNCQIDFKVVSFYPRRHNSWRSQLKADVWSHPAWTSRKRLIKATLFTWSLSFRAIIFTWCGTGDRRQEDRRWANRTCLSPWYISDTWSEKTSVSQMLILSSIWIKLKADIGIAETRARPSWKMLPSARSVWYWLFGGQLGRRAWLQRRVEVISGASGEAPAAAGARGDVSGCLGGGEGNVYQRLPITELRPVASQRSVAADRAAHPRRPRLTEHIGLERVWNPLLLPAD